MAKTLNSRWKIVRDLPEGGQAHVFLVEDLQSDQQSLNVLKRLKNVDRLDRLSKELKAYLRLDHPNIIRLIDAKIEGDPPYYLVTEYCQGGSLAESERFWDSNPAEGLRLFRQLLEGVIYAHQHGVIHRDIKPANIFLRGDRGPLVLGDFGLSFLDGDGTRVTLTEEAVGSRYYMAPEVEDGKTDLVSAKSDTYSLGKVLYWLLSGGKIFSREKHRDQNFDLKGYDTSSRLEWKNIYMEHVNRILDYMITTDPTQRRPPSDLMVTLDEAIHLVEKEFNPIDPNIRQPCNYCGAGQYSARAVDKAELIEFGLTHTHGADWRILVCTLCGHVELFRVDLSLRKDWWQQGAEYSNQTNYVVPDWHRAPIDEWVHPREIPRFKPIPFGNVIARKDIYPDVRVPFKKPYFGPNRIPFELNVRDPAGSLRGLEHRPRTPEDLERSTEIVPGTSGAVAAYALITSGNAQRIVENVEFVGMRIGFLEFYLDVGEPIRIELILGKNIRDWSYKHPLVVGALTDVAIEQVWRDDKDEATVDMLRIDFSAPVVIMHCQVCAHFESLSPSYPGDIYPSIRLAGLTYRLAEPAVR